jgi:hypothetical protein
MSLTSLDQVLVEARARTEQPCTSADLHVMLLRADTPTFLLGNIGASWMLPYLRAAMNALPAAEGRMREQDLEVIRTRIDAARAMVPVLRRGKVDQDLLLHYCMVDHQGWLVVRLLQPITECLPDLQDSRITYLQIVAYYDRQHREPVPDWQGCYARFEAIQPGDMLTLGYKENYLLLTGIKCGDMPAEILERHYQGALNAASQIEKWPEQDHLAHQLLGYTTLNWARYLHGLNRIPESKTVMIEAGKSRLLFLSHLHAQGASEALLKAARSQAHRIFADWPKLYGAESLGECPVTAEIAAELERQGINPEFRLK